MAIIRKNPEIYLAPYSKKSVIKNKKNFIQPWKPLMVKNRSLDEAKRNPGPPGPDVTPAPEIQAGSLG